MHPSKLSSLYPNKSNITSDEQLPIPIEIAYFLEDSEPDNTKLNRYYFNFPADWITSNRGESIIGVRNIFMMPRRRKLKFTIGIRKYHKEDYDDYVNTYGDYGLDFVFKQLPEYRKSETTISVISWLQNDADLRAIFKDLNDAVIAQFEVANEEIEAFNRDNLEYFNAEIDKQIDSLSKQSTQITGEIENLDREIQRLQSQIDNEKDITQLTELTTQLEEKQKELINKRNQIDELANQMNELEEQKKANKFKPLFQQETEKLRRRDIQMDGRYDNERNCFVETIESQKNEYYVDFSITFKPRPIDDKSNNDEYDFADVMNIGYNPYQNNPDKYMNGKNGIWMRKIEFENVWDRHSCKVYSSIAGESSNGYLGNSQVYFIPIKYFKLNSTDQRFWIEFYSATCHKIPIKIPTNESFVIEMQLLPYRKLLYV